jgi:hypothetical protein
MTKVQLFDGSMNGDDRVLILESLWKATDEVNRTKKWDVFKGKLRGTPISWHQKCEKHKALGTWDVVVDKF